MRPQKAATDRVRIVVRISEAMMESVPHRPPVPAALEGLQSDHGQEETQAGTGGVRAMRPQAVVACCDTEQLQPGLDDGGDGYGTGGQWVAGYNHAEEDEVGEEDEEGGRPPQSGNRLRLVRSGRPAVCGCNKRQRGCRRLRRLSW